MSEFQRCPYCNEGWLDSSVPMCATDKVIMDLLEDHLSGDIGPLAALHKAARIGAEHAEAKCTQLVDELAKAWTERDTLRTQLDNAVKTIMELNSEG
jgi:hypothetical protein